MKKLIEYITKEPTEDEHKRGHKFPFMSAEILSAEISKIMDFFLISDAEMEMKDKILKNIDNELSFSDEFPEVKPKGGHIEAEKSEPETATWKPQGEINNKPEGEEFMDVIEENSDKYAEKKESKENKNCGNDAQNQASYQVENDAHKQEESKEINEDNDNIKCEKALEEANKKEEEMCDMGNITFNNNDNVQNKENVADVASKPEEPSDRIDLLEFLLEFIETEGEINYVLAGYFSKFFIALLNRNSAAVCF